LEEQEAFPLLDSVLREQDWASIIEQSPNHDDPVFDKPDKIRFQTLFEYLSRVEQGETPAAG